MNKDHMTPEKEEMFISMLKQTASEMDPTELFARLTARILEDKAAGNLVVTVNPDTFAPQFKTTLDGQDYFFEIKPLPPEVPPLMPNIEDGSDAFIPYGDH